FCLLGPNGSGKTTTTHLFLGFTTPTSGSARVCGFDATSDHYRVRQTIAYIPDQISLYGPLSGLENLRYLTTLAGFRKLKDAELIAYLEEAGLSEEAARRRAGGYSKGMRQKVGVALALAKEAKVLLLDEPTTGLDPESIAEFGRLIQRLAQQGVATLMATHDLALASEIGTRIGMMRAGQLEKTITPQALGELLHPAVGLA
ncbi:ABC transporter ATP-binding protein, partial [bacterium]